VISSNELIVGISDTLIVESCDGILLDKVVGNSEVYVVDDIDGISPVSREEA
jgi:hypothetical protein